MSEIRVNLSVVHVRFEEWHWNRFPLVHLGCPLLWVVLSFIFEYCRSLYIIWGCNSKGLSLVPSLPLSDSVCCECCVLSGRSLCNKLFTRPEESYWLGCVVVCDIETSWIRRPWPTGGCRAKNKQANTVFLLRELVKGSRVLMTCVLYM